MLQIVTMLRLFWWFSICFLLFLVSVFEVGGGCAREQKEQPRNAVLFRIERRKFEHRHILVLIETFLIVPLE